MTAQMTAQWSADRATECIAKLLALTQQDVRAELEEARSQVGLLGSELAELREENKLLRRSRIGGSVKNLCDELAGALKYARELEADNEKLRRELRLAQGSAADAFLGRHTVLTRGGFYVYFLLDKLGRVVYVGKSSALFGRISNHAGKDWEWTEVSVTRVHSAYEMDTLEEDKIHQLHPRYNKHCPRSGCAWRGRGGLEEGLAGEEAA
jgi:hypothetical protein